MSVQLFPYTELQGTVNLRVTSVKLDGKVMPWQNVDQDELVVELRNPDEHRWEWATLDLEVTGPGGEIQLRSADLADVSAVAVLDCGATNHRISAVLTQAVGATWNGSLELHRADWYGQAALSATIVATVERVESRQAGFAKPWKVRFDDLPPREIHDSMRVQWENFEQPAADNRAFLLEFAEDICFLRLDQGEPVLFLNEGFENLRALLEVKPGRPKAQQILRTQILKGMASQAWNAMFMAALEAIEVEDDLPGLPPEDWQRNVLNIVLPRLYPHVSLDEARNEAWEARRDPVAAAGLQERLLPALSQQVQQPKALRAALKDIVSADHQEQE